MEVKAFELMVVVRCTSFQTILAWMEKNMRTKQRQTFKYLLIAQSTRNGVLKCNFFPILV